MARLSYEDSWHELQRWQLVAVGDVPPLPRNLSRHDDTVPGVSFFRTMLADAKLARLTLPRTFFGRAEIRAVSFCDTDLSESVANWNDFIAVDFSWADLSRSDLRASLFERVRFVGTALVGVDFRYCGFKHCDFTDADVAEARFTVKAGTALRFLYEQRSIIDWQADDGEEPVGGMKGARLDRLRQTGSWCLGFAHRCLKTTQLAEGRLGSEAVARQV